MAILSAWSLLGCLAGSHRRKRVVKSVQGGGRRERGEAYWRTLDVEQIGRRWLKTRYVTTCHVTYMSRLLVTAPTPTHPHSPRPPLA